MAQLTNPSASAAPASAANAKTASAGSGGAKQAEPTVVNTRPYLPVLITEEAIDLWSKPVSATARAVYKVGDKIFIIDLVNKCCPAEVIQVDGNKIFIHYTGWSRKWDEWVYSCNHPSFVSKDAQTMKAQCCDGHKRIQPDFKIGDRLTVLDSVSKESEAVVRDVQVKDVSH